MKKILILCFALLSLNLIAQDTPKPVKWTSYLEDNEEGETEIIIKAIIEKDWHVFTSAPGGDGLAIPTTIVVGMMIGDLAMELPVGDEVANQTPKEMTMEGMGKLKYYEGELSYAFPINSLKTRKFTVTVNYQTCNDKMCLPPETVVLDVSDASGK
jgi:thiol:disulfide interchange protein